MAYIIKDKKKYFTIPEYAKINDVSVKTIYEWLKADKLEKHKLGSLTFVRLKAKQNERTSIL